MNIHKQVAIIEFNSPQEVTYFVEYRSGGWDVGLVQRTVVIHQLRPDGFAYYAGSIGIRVGAISGVTLFPAGPDYVDTQYNLSVRILTSEFLPEDSVQIQIAHGNMWQDSLPSAGQVPVAPGTSPTSWYTTPENVQHIAYVGTDGLIHECFFFIR